MCILEPCYPKQSCQFNANMAEQTVKKYKSDPQMAEQFQK